MAESLIYNEDEGYTLIWLQSDLKIKKTDFRS